MRDVRSSPDMITRAISDIISEKERKQHKIPSDGLHVWGSTFQKFWAMKQRGELHESEAPAVWAVMMRAIDASEVVRIVLRYAAIGAIDSGTSQARALINFCNETHRNASGVLRPQFIAKVRGNLVTRLKQVVAQDTMWISMTLFDPSDAELLLRACQTAVEVKQEDDKRWHTRSS